MQAGPSGRYSKSGDAVQGSWPSARPQRPLRQGGRMRVVKADRWHKVELAADSAADRRCSVCGSLRLAAPGETVLDGTTRTRYRVVRCAGCGFDLLEPLPKAFATAS